MKYFIQTLLVLMVIVNAQQSGANEGVDRAQQDHELQLAVTQASHDWKKAFNQGDANTAAAMYEKDAVMVVKPFGTYKGRAQILAFWTQLIEQGFAEVVYDSTVVKLLDKNSAIISANWRMNNAHGIITQELWVLQPDGRAMLREDHFEVAQ